MNLDSNLIIVLIFCVIAYFLIREYQMEKMTSFIKIKNNLKYEQGAINVHEGVRHQRNLGGENIRWGSNNRVALWRNLDKIKNDPIVVDERGRFNLVKKTGSDKLKPHEKWSQERVLLDRYY